MISQDPLVSCIMPTYNRRKFIPYAVQYFLRQDYKHKELIIIDDGTDPVEDLINETPSVHYYKLDQKMNLGDKLNLACKKAKGEIIANWDDDDWYDPVRLSYQVGAIKTGKIDVCGINQLLYLDLQTKDAYQYIYPANQKIWLLGSSLCFTKDLWRKNPFESCNVGMDAWFVWRTPSHRVKALPHHKMAVHMIHQDNTSPKRIKGSWWHHYPIEGVKEILHADWETYSNGKFGGPSVKVNGNRNEITPETKTKQLKNIHACLVHENEDCVIDLVRNLHYQDPNSQILVLNGGQDERMFQAGFAYGRFNALVFPKPLALKYGNLLPFGLKAMEYATELGDFDTLTIVDSDQLAIMPGYSAFLSEYLSSKTNTGMLSNKPERIAPDNRELWTAVQAYKEFDLWKPLLKQFPNGESHFVHWTFWPSTVFTRDAVKDLLGIFTKNERLKSIIRQSKLWAAEEVVFPTLVKILGYETETNPCSNEFVSFKKTYSTSDLELAYRDSNTYWLHPVDRKYDDPVRKYVRQQAGHYQKPNGLPTKTKLTDVMLTLPLLESIREIEGWLGEKEADLLMSITLKSCTSLPVPHRIVEIGSFHGKSTVLMGAVARAYFPEARVYAIDPHEGMLGAVDQGIEQVQPSLENFQHNIKRAGLTDTVVLIKDYSYRVLWEEPISLLFIDGLHDYPNVARDFYKFSPYVVPGGLIAFHDYADYYPGVMALVNEVLDSPSYQKVKLVESLIVIQKL